MKKAFFGYNIREVDENMEYLEEMNAKLEKQVKQLTAELESLKNTDREFEALADLPDAPKNDEELAAAQEEIASLKIENEKMKTTIRNMAKELDAQKNAAAAEADDLTKVSQICRAAYADMADAKQDTKEKLARFVGEFLSQWASYRQKIDAVTAEVSRACDESRESFLAAADAILQQYSDLNGSAEKFAKYFDQMDALEESVKADIDEALRELDQPEESDVQPVDEQPEEPAEEMEPQRAIFRALKKRADTKKETVVEPAAKEDASKEPAQAPAVEKPREALRDVPGEIGISISVNPKNIVNG